MTGRPLLVFLHGTAGEPADLEPQLRRLGREYPVLAPALPRTGKSIAAFASAVDAELASHGARPGGWIPIGHSLGGLVALELAVRSPLQPAACALIDAPMLIPWDVAQGLSSYEERFRSSDARSAIREFAERHYFHPEDDSERRARLLRRLMDFPVDAFNEINAAINGYDAEAAARRCRVPGLYVQAAVPADLSRLVALNPRFGTAMMSRPSHYAPLELPEELASVLEGFVAGLGLSRRSACPGAPPP